MTERASLYRFKDICTIPEAKNLVDVVLSQTQRRTPTVVHPQFKISRIRSFYIRKVKFCNQTFYDIFTRILDQFPRLDDIHPFYADLCNVMYDRDHYKIALGQINTVRGIVGSVCKDYVRLLKYADSPYKCKMLKRAALGRMCTAVKKLSASIKYLEDVRQHLSRLPSINPSGRSLILTGYPNVGKSSFINSISHANVDVQPYAFTTKSLYVGHFDYNYVRWQVIDTPGILDRKLEERNIIELTAMTALAHIHAAVLFFLDISEQCGFTIESQVSLFKSIKVLFKNRPLVIVLNKVDVITPDQLPPETLRLIQTMADGIDGEDDTPSRVKFVNASCLNKIGIDECKNTACELLLAQRVEQKIVSKRADAIATQLVPTATAAPLEQRPPCIPTEVLERRALGLVKLRNTGNGGEDGTKRPQGTTDEDEEEEELSDEDEGGSEKDSGLSARKKGARKKMLLRDIEELEGGPGVFNIDLSREWQLKKDEWRHDMAPEFFNGKNVSDFIDPEIEEKLRKLEMEEEQQLLATAAMSADAATAAADWADASNQWNTLHEKANLKRLENRLRTNLTRKWMPRTKRNVNPTTGDQVVQSLRKIGYDVDDTIDSVPTTKRAPSVIDKVINETNETLEDDDTEDDDDEEEEQLSDEEGEDGGETKQRRARKHQAVKARATKTLTLMRRSRTATAGVKSFDDRIRAIKQRVPNRISKALHSEELQRNSSKVKRLNDRELRKTRMKGEADRFIGTKKPRHLYSGKSSSGTSDWR